MKTRFALFFSLAVAAMLVIAACGNDDDNGNGAAADSYDVEMGEMYFDPDAITASAGQEITLNFENVGSVLHDFTIDDLDGQRVHEEFAPGESGSVTIVMPDTAGTIQFHCSVPGHEQAGMHGTIQVN